METICRYCGKKFEVPDDASELRKNMCEECEEDYEFLFYDTERDD